MTDDDGKDRHEGVWSLHDMMIFYFKLGSLSISMQVSCGIFFSLACRFPKIEIVIELSCKE